MRTPIKTKGSASIKILRNIVFRFNKDGGRWNGSLKLALKETRSRAKPIRIKPVISMILLRKIRCIDTSHKYII
jgi:hypothetical protein